jgi:hypothetical protein
MVGVADHPLAFWLILIGGVLTVAGLVLTISTVVALRKAVRTDAGRVFVTGSSRGGPIPPPPYPDPPPIPIPLEHRVRVLEMLASRYRWQWQTDIREAVYEAVDDAQHSASTQAFELTVAIRELIAPLTKQWGLAGLSAILLVLGVVLQTIGSLIALY